MVKQNNQIWRLRNPKIECDPETIGVNQSKRAQKQGSLAVYNLELDVTKRT
jgi:hypothetical protein